MYPILFEIGPLKLYSFGLMVVMAFLVGGWLATLELTRRKLEPNHLEGYPLLALVGGIVGARVYYLMAHFDQLIANPMGTIFDGAGLTWYGGLIGGAAAVLYLARRRKQNLWSICDSFAPGLAAAYGVGRIGCQLAGDGDYGPPSDVPWATAYPNGVVPSIEACHPTPVYEVLMMIVVTSALWKMRTRVRAPGWLFSFYLMFVGIERWISEIWRVRPDRPGGMSVAQWISVGILLAGVLLWQKKRSQPAHA